MGGSRPRFYLAGITPQESSLNVQHPVQSAGGDCGETFFATVTVVGRAAAGFAQPGRSAVTPAAPRWGQQTRPVFGFDARDTAVPSPGDPGIAGGASRRAALCMVAVICGLTVYAGGMNRSPAQRPLPTQRGPRRTRRRRAASAAVMISLGVVATTVGPLAARAADPSSVPMPQAGVFNPYSQWHLNVAGSPLADRSPEMARGLAAQVQKYYGSATINIDTYSTTFYTATSTTPRTDVAYNDCHGLGFFPPELKDSFLSVPIPANAVPVGGTDAEMTIWDPRNDKLWEFWRLAKTSTGWSACYGGRIDSVSRNPGYFPRRTGATATSLPNAGGMIGIREAQAGVITHALSLQLVDTERAGVYSYPAQRSDGYNPDAAPDRIAEGTRLRLDPTIDVTTLNLPPLAAMVARAAQRFGFIVTDKGGAVAVLAESGIPAQRATGVNPWTKLLNGQSRNTILKDFPWQHVQVLPKDWAKPKPGEASARPGVEGPASVARGAVVQLTVRAQAGLRVELLFRRRGASEYVVRRYGTTDSHGTYATSYRADDDYRYFARAGTNRLPSALHLTSVSH
jgi:hypothetical protein